MCIPDEVKAGLAVAFPVTALANAPTLLKAQGKIDEGDAAADAARRQAAIEEQDAVLAEGYAVESIQRAEAKAGKIRESGSRLIGEQRLAYASGNVDVTSGSAAAAQVDTAQLTAEAVKVARLDGAREAQGYRAQGSKFNALAAAHRSAADNYQSAGKWGAVGSVIDDVSKVGQFFTKWWK